ncbi:SPFH domain-containing protein [Modestobacter sp. L9-4]|uniref:SPFH domain-containing protein n=1 Tax=Modestobacter sp. L9-4 TaxID=2851567 RepID=UPI001C7430CA|nr:SPFH domain-containing protein [Modestobacter sp. L9-4]QXG77704.1 SPFH domain-containing protein [Modestobacter sp. L9-4]
MPIARTRKPAEPSGPAGSSGALPVRPPARRRSGARVLLGLVLALVVLVAGVIPGIAWAAGFTKADGGHVVVVRNGGLFDDNSIRQVIQPNSSLTSTGLYSKEHPYPSTQRNFKVSGQQDADSNEVINVPTKDGVLVGVEGTFYFDVNFTDAAVMSAFDDKYGTRTYPGPDGLISAWDGDEGWSAFLNFTLGNLVQNVLRQEIGNVECADLVASCSLAANSSAQAAAAAVIDPNANGNQTINGVQAAVNDAFSRDVNDVLGVDILVNPRFVLSKIELPQNVQDAINQAQAAFAGVTESQAALQRAEIDAKADAARQAGYNDCPTCAQIDIMKSLPSGLTTYAPGTGFTVSGK